MRQMTINDIVVGTVFTVVSPYDGIAPDARNIYYGPKRIIAVDIAPFANVLDEYEDPETYVDMLVCDDQYDAALEAQLVREHSKNPASHNWTVGKKIAIRVRYYIDSDGIAYMNHFIDGITPVYKWSMTWDNPIAKHWYKRYKVFSESIYKESFTVCEQWLVIDKAHQTSLFA